MPRMVDGDDPVPVKFECKEVDPSRKQLSCTHIVASGTVTNSEVSTIKANRKSAAKFYCLRTCIGKVAMHHQLDLPIE